MLTRQPPLSPGGGHYPGGGYAASFGQHEPESLDQQRVRLQQRSSAQEADPLEDDIGENDWSVSYADMVTLLMAFFVILTSVTVNNPHSPVGITPDARHEQSGPSSPFDGQGLTLAEFGMPANQDNVISRYDDPDAQGGTTDPAPSGEAETGISAAPTPLPPPPAATPDNPNLPDPAGERLAQQLQQMVSQSNLSGQVEIISGSQSVTVRISDRILFSSGKALLEDGGKALVQRLSAILAQTAQQGGIISIEGHTDNIPINTAQYPSNWELSAARAAMVVRELVAMGLPAGRLRAIGYAETRPVNPNDTSTHRAANRRVELVITTESPSASPSGQNNNPR